MQTELIQKIELLYKKIEKVRPLTPAILKELKDYYRLGLTYSSNALEGNTLDLSETKLVIEDGLTVGGKPLRDHLEAIGHAESFDYLYKNFRQLSLTEEFIKKTHFLFYQRIGLPDAGQYRSISVFISGSSHIPPKPERLEQLMGQFCTQMSHLENQLHPVAWAAQVHRNFVDIHPFVDGNGRTARLLMNFALLKKGFPIIICPPAKRLEYIRALEASRKDMPLFENFVGKLVCEGLRDYIRLMSI